MPVRSGRADSGRGGRVGAEAQQHERRQSPRRPFGRSAYRSSISPEPAHRRTNEGLMLIPRPRHHRNRDLARNPSPVAPAVELGKVVAPHDPNEPHAWMASFQHPKRVDGVARSQPSFDCGHANRSAPRQALGRRKAHLERSHVGRIRLERIARRHEPPCFIQTKRPDRVQCHTPVPAMRRIERSAEQPDVAAYRQGKRIAIARTKPSFRLIPRSAGGMAFIALISSVEPILTPLGGQARGGKPAARR